MEEFFRKFALQTTKVVASPWTFILFLFVFGAGYYAGYQFQYSETWGKWMHVGIGTITFFLALLIQNAENRNAKATHLKLDEIIRAVEGAKNDVAASEELTEEELKQHRKMVRRELKQTGATPTG